MAKIQYLKNKDGDIVFPVTHERSVKGSDGVLLERKLTDLWNAISDSSSYSVISESNYNRLVSLDDVDPYRWYFVKFDDSDDLNGIYIGTICAAKYSEKDGGVSFGDHGKSAYELAQDEGFEGTIQEWLNSLVGPAGITSVEVSSDNEGAEGNPTVTRTFQNGVLSIHFSGIKGRTGTRGPAGVNEVAIGVDDLPGQARAVATLDDGILSIYFYGLKGDTGEPGTNNAEILVVNALPQTPSTDTLNKVYWVRNSQTGYYDQYVTQRVGNELSWVQMGSTEIDLSDYVRKDSEVWLTREEFDALEIKDTTVTYNIYEVVSDV